MVWDNSDPEYYVEGYEFLKANGFRRLDAVGMGPINIEVWSTSVFYRQDNGLGI